jgi:hypothetical protein
MANWIVHTLCTNCFLKHVIEGKIEEKKELTRRRGRRLKQLQDNLTESRINCKLKKKTLDRTVWKTRCGRGRGPVARQNT